MCSMRNATAGSGCFVFLAWSGLSCKRKTWVPKWDEKKTEQTTSAKVFVGKDLSATTLRISKKPNQYSPPIKYRKNFSPFFDVENKSRTSATSWLFGGKVFFKGVSHGNHQKWLRVELILMNFDRQQNYMHPQHHVSAILHPKKLWFSGWQFWDQINPW